MKTVIKGIDYKKLCPFLYFKNFPNNRVLITNNVGDYAYLKSGDFSNLLSNRINPATKVYKQLVKRNFVGTNFDFPLAIQECRKLNSPALFGPSLHIVIPTLRCNHTCIYCHASSPSVSGNDFDMKEDLAHKVVDTIFKTPNNNITIEFQGGEPLLNWKIVKLIIALSKRKNRECKKDLRLTIVSNLSIMDRRKMDFLLKEDVRICTSLDGPEHLHNLNRKLIGGNSYKETTRWLKIISKELKHQKKSFLPGALTTVTRNSLQYPRQIVDEFVKLGIESIYPRPFSPFGMGKKNHALIEFSSDDFISFYKEVLDYIITLNKKGILISESLTRVFLTKILLKTNPGHMDYRSPCGAAIGQLAYNYNGDIYTCDEGRMLSMMNDESFKLGNVAVNSYNEIMYNDTVKTMCVASCLDGLPVCNQCVYKPYCGVCPLYNYLVDGNIFSFYKNSRCKINMAIFDYIFMKLDSPEGKYLKNWFHGERRREE